MIRVRYPNGQTVQYNNANQVQFLEHCWRIRRIDKDVETELYACIQPTAGVLVELIQPCRVYNGVTDPEELGWAVIKDLENLRGDILRKSKERLKKFDSRTESWK